MARAQDTMRLMFDTMDAYDRVTSIAWQRIYAEDASWINADPGRCDRTGLRLRPGRQCVHLRGAPNRGGAGLPLDGGCRVGAGPGIDQGPHCEDRATRVP